MFTGQGPATTIVGNLVTSDGWVAVGATSQVK